MRNAPNAITSVMIVTLLVWLSTVQAVTGQEWTLEKDQRVEQPKPYSPYVDQHFPQQVFFGDTHFHSSLSVDSGLIGNNKEIERSDQLCS